jgi:superfamily I DNA/RNA helicase
VFSNPIKQSLAQLVIPCSDPDAVERMLAEPANRRMLEVFRLLVKRHDSLAWAGLLKLTRGIGENFFTYIYDGARRGRIQFGEALLEAYAQDLPDGPGGSSTRAQQMMRSVIEWLDGHEITENVPEGGWGNWMLETAGDDIVPTPSEGLATLLRSLDDFVEGEQDLGRYLGQINPLGKDITLAESQGVRIMTMMGAKGLTVRATIIGALEEGIIPRPDTDLGEDRRLLYVAMTRSREFLYGTRTRRRNGPTARVGAPRIAIARRPTSFFDGGPVRSEDGNTYITRRWRR